MAASVHSCRPATARRAPQTRRMLRTHQRREDGERRSGSASSLHSGSWWLPTPTSATRATAAFVLVRDRSLIHSFTPPMQVRLDSGLFPLGPDVDDAPAHPDSVGYRRWRPRPKGACHRPLPNNHQCRNMIFLISLFSAGLAVSSI